MADALDEGYSPPERPSALVREGPHETLDERLSEEIPEPDPYADDDVDEEDNLTVRADEENLDDEPAPPAQAVNPDEIAIADDFDAEPAQTMNPDEITLDDEECDVAAPPPAPAARRFAFTEDGAGFYLTEVSRTDLAAVAPFHFDAHHPRAARGPHVLFICGLDMS